MVLLWFMRMKNVLYKVFCNVFYTLMNISDVTARNYRLRFRYGKMNFLK